jgi:hypothetical protein
MEASRSWLNLRKRDGRRARRRKAGVTRTRPTRQRRSAKEAKPLLHGRGGGAPRPIFEYKDSGSNGSLTMTVIRATCSRTQ